jgi:hypothetical protein
LKLGGGSDERFARGANDRQSHNNYLERRWKEAAGQARDRKVEKEEEEEEDEGNGEEGGKQEGNGAGGGKGAGGWR